MDLSRRTFLGLAAAAAAGPFVLRHRVADAAVDPSVVGQWAPRVKQPNIAIHMTSLPGTPRLWMGFTHWQTRGVKAWVYDYATNQTFDASLDGNKLKTDYDFMCGGGLLDDDGRLRLYGGRVDARKTVVFDPADFSYKMGPALTGAAYYCSALRTGQSPGYSEGAILIGYGKRQFMDIYDPENYATTVVTRLPITANLSNIGSQIQYPRLHLVPDGSIALLGPEKPLQRLDMTSYKWSSLGTMVKDRRFEGCTTQLPGTGYEYLLTGGDPIGSSTTQERINLLDGTPKSRWTTPYKFQRRQLNTVITPNGLVYLMGGMGTVAGLPAGNAPEEYNPATETVRLMSDTPAGPDKPSYRAYHSCADLLDDGRIVWAGGVAGVNGWSLEIFSPPYLFDANGLAPRPNIALAPANANVLYGALALFSSSAPGDISRVVMMRPGHMSHGYNAEQRHIECQFLTFPDGTIQVLMPTNPNLAPAGWYRVFALNSAGVPSICQWLRLAFD